MDEELRRLERRAATGDLEAQELLIHKRLQAGLCSHGELPTSCSICQVIAQQFELLETAIKENWALSNDIIIELKELIIEDANQGISQYKCEGRGLFQHCRSCGGLILDVRVWPQFPYFSTRTFGVWDFWEPSHVGTRPGEWQMICLGCEPEPEPHLRRNPTGDEYLRELERRAALSLDSRDLENYYRELDRRGLRRIAAVGSLTDTWAKGRIIQIAHSIPLAGKDLNSEKDLWGKIAQSRDASLFVVLAEPLHWPNDAPPWTEVTAVYEWEIPVPEWLKAWVESNLKPPTPSQRNPSGDEQLRELERQASLTLDPQDLDNYYRELDRRGLRKVLPVGWLGPSSRKRHGIRVFGIVQVARTIPLQESVNNQWGKITRRHGHCVLVLLPSDRPSAEWMEVQATQLHLWEIPIPGWLLAHIRSSFD